MKWETKVTIILAFILIIKIYISLLNHVKNKKWIYQTIVIIILAFLIAHLFIFIEVFIFLYASSYCLMFFHFLLQDSFEHFRQCRSLSNAFPQISSGNVLISPLLLKESFARHRILGLQFFFSSLNISAHCLLTTKVSDEKSVHNLIEEICVLTLVPTSCVLAALHIVTC